MEYSDEDLRDINKVITVKIYPTPVDDAQDDSSIVDKKNSAVVQCAQIAKTGLAPFGVSDSINLPAESQAGGEEDDYMKAPPGYKTTADAAAFLGVAIRTLKYWRKNGKFIPALNDNGHYFYSDAQLADLKNGANQNGANQNGANQNGANQNGETGENGIVDSDFAQYQARFKPTVTDAEIMALRKMPNDKVDELKSKIKFADPAKIFLPARKSGYICPFCGNGTGSTGDGIKPTPANDGYAYHCFKSSDCEGDLLNIIAKINGLDLQKDFHKILAIGQKILETAYNGKFSDIEITAANVQDDADQVSVLMMIRQYIKAHCKDGADKIPVKDRRGLTADTLNHCCVFFDEHWTHPKFFDSKVRQVPTRRIIIPTGYETYVAVMPDSDRTDANKNYWKMNAGYKNIYHIVDKNKCTPPFDTLLVTEGEFDALSIFQATDHKYLTMAIGGTSNYKNFIKLISAKSNLFTKNFLIVILFDPDDSGRKCAKDTTALLRGKGYAAVDCLIDDKLDANAYLQKHGDDALKSRLEEIISDAQKQLPEIQAELTQRDESKIGENAVKFATTKSKIPSCPVDLYIPGGYGIDEFCIAEQGKPFTSTPTVITKAFIDVDSGLYYSELAFYKKATGKWKRGIIVQDDVIADNKKFLPLASQGIDVTAKSAKPFVVYLMSLKHFWRNEDLIPKVHLHNFTGWTDKTFKTFIYPCRPLEGHKLKNDEKYYGEKYVALGDYKKWRAKITELYNLYQTRRFNSGVFLLTLGVALAAPAVKILKTRNLQLLLSCTSGSGKSCVAKAAISVFGNPLELKHTFDGTAISLSELSTYYNDLPMWLDEFQSAKKGLREEVDKFIYSYAEAVPRLRCKRIGGLNLEKMITFHGSRIMTGEESMLKDNSNAGAYNRLLIVTTDKIFPIGWDIAATHRFFENNCGHFGIEWIKYLSEHSAEMKEEFENALDSDEELITTDIIKCRKDWAANWQEFFIVLYIVLKHAMPLMINNFNLIDFVNNYCNMVTAVSDDVPSNNSGTNHERAKVALEDYINGHNKNFKVTVILQSGEMITRHPAQGQTLQGYINEELQVDFIPGELTKILERELGFTSAKAIIREFAKTGWLEYNANSSSFQKRPYQKNIKAFNDDSKTLKWSWVYRFKKGVLQINTDTVEIAE